MNIGIVLSGGTGTRLGGDIPKQYIKVEGKMILEYALSPLIKSSFIDKIQIVANEKWQDCILDAMNGDEIFKDKFTGFSVPGDTRQLSIWNAMNDIKDRFNNSLEDLNILIHDGARPLLTEKMVNDCIRELECHDGVLPALPVKDTMYLCTDGGIELLDRSKVVAGQAPEAFKFNDYYKANERLFPDKIRTINGSSEPAILAGLDIATIPGDERNFKVTTMEDLDRFVGIINQH